MLCERLKLCADFVKGDFACDVGTDHALLPVYLVEKGICKRALACDIADGPLESARKNIARSQLSNAIKTLKSDGLDDVCPNGITDVIIAGMGGETICDIIFSPKANWLKCGVNLILQPQSKADVLRRKLSENGFETLCEKAVCDGKFNYAVMQACYCGISSPLTDVFAAVGKLDVSLESGKKYAQFQAKRFYNAAKGLYASGNIEKADIFTKISQKILQKSDRKKMTISEIYDIIDVLAPFNLQESYDNSGLIVGSMNGEVSKVLLSLDITAETVREASKLGAQLIVSHHPVIFSPIKRLCAESVPYMLAHENIAAICAHTSLDMAAGGVNDVLFDMIEKPLGIALKGEIFEKISDDIGYGRICELENELCPDEAAKILKNVFGCSVVRYVKGAKKIKTLAYCSGSGGSALKIAADKGVDALITGDVKHSVWIEAKNLGVSLFDCGHYHTERIILPKLKQLIINNTTGVEVLISECDRDPVSYCF